MSREMNDQEMASVGDRAGSELKERLLAVRKRKRAVGKRTPAIEAVRQRMMDEQRRERER
jgi:hypothetical protein